MSLRIGSGRFAAFVAALVFNVCAVSGASAQTALLFSPVAQNQMRDVTPSQTNHLRSLQDRPTTRALQLVQVAPAALDARTVSIPLPNGTVLQADVLKKLTRSATDYTWMGTLPGGGGVTLVVQDGDMIGSIRTGSELYQVVPLGSGAHALVEVDQARFPPEHPPGPLPVTPGATPVPDRRGDAAPASEVAADAVRVDVLVPYTTSAKAAVANISAMIQLAVDESNQAYVNSNANVVLRLVGTMEVTGYVEGSGSAGFNTALSDVTDGTLPSMAAVHAMRDAKGADVVAFIINDSAACGLGWLTSTAEYAFVAVHYSCATGYYSFAHEIGHNFGARHDPEVDPATTPYAWGHGYHFGNSWRTIMAYADYCGGCPRLQYFSNPSVLYQGVPMGSANLNDNARVHRDRGPTMASFRPEVSSSQLYAATLPSSRSVQVGQAATAFATILNAGAAATGCGVAPLTSVPASFTFQTTDPATNAATGPQNTRVSIAAGAAQTYVVAFTPTAPMASTNVTMDFGCTGQTSVAPIVGINSLLLTFSSTPVPDMIAVGLSPSNDGYSRLTGAGSSGIFVISSSNIGVAGQLTARVRLFNSSTPLVASVCETFSSGPNVGQCKSPAAATSTRVINQNENTTWTAFLSATAAIAQDPAVNRIAFEFLDAGNVVRGSTSIAVTTSP